MAEGGGIGGIRAAAQRVADHARTLARLEVELAQAEMRQKGAKAGAGIAMFVVAAMLGFIALETVIALLTAVLAIWLPVWAAILIMLGVVVLAAGGIAYMGSRLLKSASPLAPTEAIAQAKKIPEAIRGPKPTAAPEPVTTVVVAPGLATGPTLGSMPGSGSSGGASNGS
jgi:hypothetical protein